MGRWSPPALCCWSSGCSCCWRWESVPVCIPRRTGPWSACWVGSAHLDGWKHGVGRHPGPAGAAQAGRPTQTAEQPPTTRTPRRRHVGQPVVIRLVVDRGDELPGHSRDAGLWAGSVIGFLFRPHCQRLLLELHLVGSGGRRPSLDYRRRLQVVDRHLRHVPRITGRHVLHVPISQLKPTICPVRVLYSNGRLQVLALAAVYR